MSPAAGEGLTASRRILAGVERGAIARRIYRGAELQAKPQTLGEMFLERCESTPELPAVMYRAGGGWRTLTFAQYADEVREVAFGLLAFGLQPGEAVLLASQTRYEWNLIDFAVLLCGGVVVPAFATLLPKTVLHQARDAGCTVAVVEDSGQLAKVVESRPQLPQLRLIVTIERTGQEDGGLIVGLDDLRAAGRERFDRSVELERRRRAMSPEDTASIVYTSGTTGLPRGVVLTHWNFIAAAGGGLQSLPIREGSSSLCVLPLAHVYQRVVNIGTVMRSALTVYSTPRTMAQDLLETRPTLMAGVPRLFERVYDRILEEVRAKGRAAERVFAWARGVAIASAREKASRGRVRLGLRVKCALADRLVYRRIRAGLGGRIETFLSGASALREDLAWFFNGIGTTLVEAYGLTETTAPANANPMDRVRPGTVGPPIAGVEEALDEDGEILIRGPIVFRRYHNLPEATVAAFTPDGFFRSGDFGTFDADGYLRFLGRKKELLKLSTAKFVRPNAIEERLKESPLIEDAVVIGDDRKFAAAVLQPYYEILVLRLKEVGVSVPRDAVTWGKNILGERVIDAMAPQVLDRPEVRTLLQAEVDRVNEELDPHERVKRFVAVPRRFTIDGEELTPTLKVRREIVQRKYAREIEALYASP